MLKRVIGGIVGAAIGLNLYYAYMLRKEIKATAQRIENDRKNISDLTAWFTGVQSNLVERCQEASTQESVSEEEP